MPKSFMNARLLNNVTSLITRDLMGRLGKSFFNRSGRPQRDIYEALGYIKTLTFQDFAARYERGDIAKRIVKAPVDESWRKLPEVKEIVTNRDPAAKIEETEFEKAWDALVKSNRVYTYLKRLDRLSGIGQYGVLLLGFDDGKHLSEEAEVGSISKLLYMTPFTEGNAAISTWETDPFNERFGMPKLYSLKMSNGNPESSQTHTVHWSRVIHVAEGADENDSYGTPRLEAVFNRLQDLEIVAGGSGEMFWRGALMGLNLEVDPEFELDDSDKADIENQMQMYYMDMIRYIRTRGVKVHNIGSQVSSPADHVAVQIQLISATTGIPQRVLMGSERGELASSQDERAWLSVCSERRDNHVSPNIIQVLIDRLIAVGILPTPAEGFSIVWPELIPADAAKAATTALTMTQALTAYIDSGAEQLMPPDFYFSKILGFSEDDVKTLTAQLNDYMEYDTDADDSANGASGDNSDSGADDNPDDDSAGRQNE